MELNYLLLYAIYIFSKSVTSVTAALGYSYVGCFVDKADKRLYQNGKRLIDKEMTVSKCRDFCMLEIATYFAIQVGNDCICGETDPDQMIASNFDEKRCDYTCISNFREKCGGYRASSVYTVCPLNTYAKAIYYKVYDCDGSCHCKVPQCSLNNGHCYASGACIDGWTGASCNQPDNRPQFVGCYANLKDKSASNMVDSGEAYVNVEKCVLTCRNKIRTYAGIGDSKCKCGDDFGVYNDAPPESCTSNANTCDQNLEYKCGNSLAFAIYRSCPFRHYGQGCVKMCNCAEIQCMILDGKCPGSVCMRGYGGERCDLEDVCFNFPCQHGGVCRQKEDGAFRCFCRLGYKGNQCEDVVDWAVPQGQAGDLLVGIFNETFVALTTTVKPNVPAYVGCYTDTIYKSADQLEWTMDMNQTPTMSQCAYYCLRKLRTYAGIRKGRFCRCVQSFVFGLKSSRSSCKTPCPGAPEEKCGGPLAYTVFTVCTMHFYLYENTECESRCNCYEGQCDATTGNCPSSLCKKGWTGPKCNEEFTGETKVEEKCYVLLRNGLILASISMLYAVGVTIQMITVSVLQLRRRRMLERSKRDHASQEKQKRRSPKLRTSRRKRAQ